MDISTLSFRNIVDKINNDLGHDFCDIFRYKRKELSNSARASSANILFKLGDDNRDWVINEGGHVEVQYHLYYRHNTIGYGLGFNAQYVPFYNEKSPIEYIMPFVKAFLSLKNQNNKILQSLEEKGFSLNGSDLKNICPNEYYFFGKVLQIQNSILSDDDYKQMLEDIQNELFNLYVAIWEQKNKMETIKYTMEDKVNEYVNLLTTNKNLILTGAPGTGKTYLAKQIAQKMIFGEVKQKMTEEERKQFDEQCGFVQFHPSYDYTDFVEGLRPIEKNGDVIFKHKNGIFKEFCEKALKDKKNNFVFIIDEINRGEISKIFGELFFSIDPGYRGKDGMVETQYQNMIEDGDTFKKGFFVPENVYIIGTMNDIDRSVESMDFAFRRRFAFKEVSAEESKEMLKSDDAWGYDENNNPKKPTDEVIESIIGNKEKNVIGKMNAINNLIWHKTIEGKQDENKSIEGLSAAYHIGASYFLKLANYRNENGVYDGESFESLWNYHLKGLLYEYLRGMQNVDKKIDKLHEAYKNEKAKEESQSMNPTNDNSTSNNG